MNQRILLVDDDISIQTVFSDSLVKSGFTVETTSTLEQACKSVLVQRFDAILLDLKLPDGNGIEWIKDLREEYPDTAIVVITGHGDIPMAVEAIRKGADNFLTKPVNMSDLKVFLRKSLELGSLRRKQSTDRMLARQETIYYGQSGLMQEVYRLAKVAAKNDSNVLLFGETGSGKGVLARWIHDQSQRGAEPFVDINCSNLKRELFASELFGHAKGAFTSAISSKKGLVEIADGGTLFLDEISEMPLDIQAEFLKVIEQKQYRRLGEVSLRKSEFRLICSSNRNLEERIGNGEFRDDLFYRINIFPIRIPPLRERKEDIPELIQYLTLKSGRSESTFDPQVLKMLNRYAWPGNIRELKNALDRAFLLADGEELKPEHFDWLRKTSVNTGDKTTSWNLETVEREHIMKALEYFQWNTNAAADALGISLSAMYRKLRKLGLKKTFS